MIRLFIGLIVFSLTIIGLYLVSALYHHAEQLSKKKKISKFWLSFIIALISIMSTVIGDIGFVLIIPLSAIIFLANNRNPIIGIIASFAAMTAGYGVNLIVTQMDFNLFETTKLSAQLLDKTYNVLINGNIIFGGVCSILLALLIAFITEKFTVKKAKKYRIDEMIDDEPLTKSEKKGLLKNLFYHH